MRSGLIGSAADGRATVAAVHAHANRQVTEALARLAPGQDRTVLEGLRLYAGALGPGTADARLPPIEIATGYRSGPIARVAPMHARYYSRTSGFGQHFESVGSIAIDGEHRRSDVAHLRWFIVDHGVRGGGLGRKLLSGALAFVDALGFTETHLWTVEGLPAARNLYEAHGFVCAEEFPGDQWGATMLEQRFVRQRPLPSVSSL